jgi:hypothetical protein
MFISCHIPKTAGTSFAVALREAFGERFYWDRSAETIVGKMFAENRVPMESVPVKWMHRFKPPAVPGVACIHGHFPLRKYLSWAFNWKNVFVTWLREPLRRRISMYYFWKACYPCPTNRYLNRIFDENWDLDRFCSDPVIDNDQSRFLARFPWRRINIVGVTENYASDLAYISQHVLRCKLKLYRENVTQGAGRSSIADFGNQFLRDYERRNWIDYRNYRAALRASEARAATFQSLRASA